MKTRALYILTTSIILLFLLSACKKDTIVDPGNLKGLVTEVGTNDGTVVSALFGANGGTLSTTDGMVDLIIPQGALSNSTNIVMQPVTNNIPMGIGKVYRLTPQNLEFTVPVKLVYHYTDNDLTGTVPEAVFAAHQDAGGIWQAHGGMVADTVKKEITAELGHFSDWGFFAAFVMNVSADIVFPDDTVGLKIQEVPGASGFASLGSSQTAPIGKAGVPSGTSGFEIDQILPLPADKGVIKGSANGAVYTAPSVFPQNSSYNLVTLIGKYKLTPSQEYHLTAQISLGGTIQFTLDGQSYFVNNIISMASSSTTTGQTSLTGSSQSPLFSIGLVWGGTGVGNYQSGGSDGKNDFGVSTVAQDYQSHYPIPCSQTSETKFLTCEVDVSSANKVKNSIRGSFSGQLSLPSGTVQCGSFTETTYREVSLIGYFRVRWTIF